MPGLPVDLHRQIEDRKRLPALLQAGSRQASRLNYFVSLVAMLGKHGNADRGIQRHPPTAEQVDRMIEYPMNLGSRQGGLSHGIDIGQKQQPLAFVPHESAVTGAQKPRQL